MIYVQVFANSCNNSSMDKTTNASGKIAWKKSIFTKDTEPEEIGYLLSAGDKIFVASSRNITAFDLSGKWLWMRKRYPLTPVSIRFDKIYFISPDQKSRMNAIDYNNKIVLEDFWIPELVDQSYLTLFEPVEKGLIAQVQYRPDPDEGEMGFVVYRIHSDGMGVEWQKNFDKQRSKLIPIVLMDKNLLITSDMSSVFEYSLINTQSDPPPIAVFPLPLSENIKWVSADNNANLFWLGNEEGITKLVKTDLTGKEVWNWNSEPADFESQAIPIFPVIAGQINKYILTSKKFFAIKDGQTYWEVKSTESDFIFATALNDDSILLVKDRLLLFISAEGKEIFHVDFDEKIVTAPVVDENGRIFVAGCENLYCIE